jgi:hypothetical protein
MLNILTKFEKRFNKWLLIIILYTEPPKLNSQGSFFLDGVCLSEAGHHQIKSLVPEPPRKKRTKPTKSLADTSADIMATIESVVAGGERFI